MSIQPLKPGPLQEYPIKESEPPEKIKEIPNNNIIYDDVSIFNIIKTYFVEKLKNLTINEMKGGDKMADNNSFDLKKYLTGFIVRRLLGIGSGFLLSIGISSSSLEEIVGAIVGGIIYFISSWLSSKKLLNSK